MPRKFRLKRNKPIRSPPATIYLQHPVGSNEWHRRRWIQFIERRAGVQKLKDRRENTNKKEIS